MITPGSRYQGAVLFSVDPGDPQPFRGLRPRFVSTAAAVLEHTIKEGDRHDALAALYYNEPRWWWRILDANPDVLYAGDLSERAAGEPLLIPRAADPR